MINGPCARFSFCIIPDFPLGLEMTTKGSLMDFLWKFEGNSYSIGRKFAQTKTQNERVGIQVD